MKKFSLIMASYAEYKLLFLLFFFSNYWPLLSNISAVSEMKSGQVSDILAPKCSSKSNVSSSREVSETTVEVGSSANTCEFMSSAYFKNCSININVNGLSKCE